MNESTQAVFLCYYSKDAAVADLEGYELLYAGLTLAGRPD